jgi:hypothetical protein
VVSKRRSNTNDTEFKNLAGYILGTTYGTVDDAKDGLQSAGMYYQYPVGFDGQSPNTLVQDQISLISNNKILKTRGDFRVSP